MISPLAYVDPEAKLGNNVTVHPFACIDKDVVIGDNCEIFPYASIVHGTRMGKNNKVYQGAIVGADPQDFRWKGEKTYCIIDDEVVIREHVIINRSIKSEGATHIGSGSFIMAESHIGHDTDVKGKCVIGNGVQIAGDAIIDNCSILSSMAIVHAGSHIGEWVMVKGGCRISGNVPPYTIMAHNPVAYYGVNAYILRIHEFPESVIDDIAKAYRHIYQCGTSLYNAIKRIELDIPKSEVRDNIVNFIRNHDMSIVASHEHRMFE